ncbi:MAG: OpgC domain-containing protein, partial [Alphaproteobacteria bacterium]
MDFWRGFALITIFVNHIPGNYFERFTYRHVSISDSADLFVFLAGWALFLAAGRNAHTMPSGQILSRLGKRALVIYAAQVLISSVAIAMLATAARILENPLLLEWHNAAAVFYDPAQAHIGLVLLTHQLGYF